MEQPIVDAEVRELLARINPLFPPVGTLIDDADEARRALAEIPRGNTVPAVVGEVEDISIRSGDRLIPLRIYRPGKNEVSRRVLVFAHGGGWVLGSLDSHDALARRVCEQLATTVISVDYRLAPEFPYPAALEDVCAAVEWVYEHQDDPQAEPQVLLLGESAGANLAVAAVLSDADRGLRRIDSLLLLYPALDDRAGTASYEENSTGNYLTSMHMRWFWEKYLAGAAADSYAAPARRNDLSALPRMFLAAAALDPLRDEGVAFAERAREAGVEVERKTYPAFHGFANFAELSVAGELLRDLSSFVARHTAKEES